jgi:hypothetical protein
LNIDTINLKETVFLNAETGYEVECDEGVVGVLGRVTLSVHSSEWKGHQGDVDTADFRRPDPKSLYVCLEVDGCFADDLVASRVKEAVSQPSTCH